MKWVPSGVGVAQTVGGAEPLRDHTPPGADRGEPARWVNH